MRSAGDGNTTDLGIDQAVADLLELGRDLGKQVTVDRDDTGVEGSRSAPGTTESKKVGVRPDTRHTVVTNRWDSPMDRATDQAHVPDGVFEVVRLAAHEDLLSNVESLAAGLTRADWIRATAPGLWLHRTAPGWSIVSTGHPANASIFVTGSDNAVLGAEKRIRDELDGGGVGELRRTIEDPHWTIWSAGEVVISLNAEPTRRHEQHVVPAIMQVAVERGDTPPEGPAPDPERARHIARSGSPLERWLLAAERDLPDDVVALLKHDRDPAVSTAIALVRASL